MEGESSADKTFNHIAFQIDNNEFDDDAGRIESLGIELLPGRSRNP